jgi:superfamily II DNA/RNA helicase
MTKFSDLKLDPKVLQAIAEAGYETPTPIQAGAIPPALEGRDVLGIAQTGTGKTASFVLPMITMLGRGRARARMPRSLVLCPTRELAAQVAENFEIYAKHTRLTKALLIGGVSFGEQDKLIDRGVDVLIATPGRLLDHFERGKLLLTGVQIMVVDEADRMLDMGFIPDIERIFQMTPFTRQTLFFSATMAPEIERITNTFLHAPERIEVARQATTSETITQRLVELVPTRKDQTATQKRDLLRRLIEAEGDKLTNAIIFCNRKVDVDILSKSLAKHGYDAAPIHGDLEQSQRTRTLESFRDGKLRLLIASDVAARGLDIPAVSHVLNYDLPSHAEDYVHRIGRTGRAGRLGTAISIATPSDEKYLTAIEALVKQTLPRVALPEGFTTSDSRASAPRPPSREDEREERSGGSRTRRRRSSSSSQRDEAQPEVSAPVAAPEAAATAAIAPAQPEQRTEDRPAPQERREEPRREPRGEQRSDRRDDRKDDRKDDRRDGRGDGRNDGRNDGRRPRGGSDNRGPRIVGMGDHVPGFMLVELRSSFASAASTGDVIEAEPQADEPAATAEAPKKTSRSRSRSRSKSAEADVRATEQPSEAVTEAPHSEAAQPETDQPEAAQPEVAQPEVAQPAPAEAAQPDVAAVPAEEAPAKPKATRSRRKTTAPADEAATEAAPKATRKRSTSAKTAATEADQSADADAPKPKATRSRRKKVDPEDQTAATAEVAAEAAPEGAAKAKPKPRTRSRKKATASDDNGDQPKDAASTDA